MARQATIKKGDSIEKKVLTSICLHQGMALKDLFDKMLDETVFDQETGEETQVKTKYWTATSRLARGIKTRRLMDYLAATGHSIVIVPNGSTVTVKKGSESLKAENIESEKITVFAGNHVGRGLSVSVLDSERLPRSVI